MTSLMPQTNIPLDPPSKEERAQLLRDACTAHNVDASRLATGLASGNQNCENPPLNWYTEGCSSFHATGFTLIELIVVMTIIALLTAAVVPIYQGSLTRIQEDRATRDFVAYLKYAQERAITDGTEYRFYLQEESRQYWIMRLQSVEDGEKVFTDPDEGPVEVKGLPEGVTFERPKARYDKDREAHFVSFYGSGACDYATITMKTADGDDLELETKGRLGRFEVRKE